MADLTRERMRARLQTLIGGDLDDDTANELLEEGNRELCVRGEWTRGRVELGPTVGEQIAYSLPDTVFRPLKVWVDGSFYRPASENLKQRIETGELSQRLGVWYLTPSDTLGQDDLAIFPAPSAGLSLETLAIVYPDPLDDDADVPPVPREFQPAPISYAAATILEGTEDNPELGSFHAQKFENFVLWLRGHRLSRTGKGPVQMRVAAQGGTD